jgi:predicted LPLAT superfamily acyltransferase
MANLMTSHWSEVKEQDAGYWHLKLMGFTIRIFPIIVARIVAYIVSFLYFVFSKHARTESRRYLDKITALEKGKKFYSLLHITAFSLALIEKVEAWCGKVMFKRLHFQEDDIKDLTANLENGKGVLLISSHLGNMELIRGLAGYNEPGVSRNAPVTVIVDFAVTGKFNRMLRELNPEVLARVISTNEIGPETVILLQDRIAAGEIVAIAGDRTSANTRNKYLRFPFLGEEAPFAYGAFFLAALLDAPTYFVFVLRQKDVSLSSQYDMHIHKNPVTFDCSRKERESRIEESARIFSEKLEYYCKLHPYQWYNYYDFWAEPAPPAKTRES